MIEGLAFAGLAFFGASIIAVGSFASLTKEDKKTLTVLMFIISGLIALTIYLSVTYSQYDTWRQ